MPRGMLFVAASGLVLVSNFTGTTHTERTPGMDRRTFLTTVAMAAPVLGQSRKPTPSAKTPAPKPAAVPPAPQGIPWTQWGGPNRNFQTEAKGLKETWPSTGPRVVW